MGLFSRKKEMDELTRQCGKLAGMEQSLPDDDGAVDSPEGKATCAQISAQAEHCLALLDKLEAALPQRGRDKNVATLAPIRSKLQLDLIGYSALSKPLPPANGE